MIQQGGDDVKRLKKEKHNDKSSEIEEIIHCANCNREMLKTDNFCQYCGSPNEDEERARELAEKDPQGFLIAKSNIDILKARADMDREQEADKEVS